MEIRRLLIALPRDNSFYRSVLSNLVRAFRELGVAVMGHLGELDEDKYASLTNNFRPDTIFHMNRARCEMPWLDGAVRHICWLVDMGGRDHTQIVGSDIVYVFSPKWMGYDFSTFTDWLPPGTVSSKVGQIDELGLDVVFLGHIPKPWSVDDLNRQLSNTMTSSYSFGELLHDFYKKIREHRANGTVSMINSHHKLKELAHSILGDKAGGGRLSTEVIYDLLERSKRSMSRIEMIDVLIASEPGNIALYGSTNWGLWDRAKPYYRGYAHSATEVRSIMTSAKFCLHQGAGMHWRSLDCMSAGGVLLYYTGSQEPAIVTENTGDPRGLHTFFEKGLHYLEVRDQQEMREVFQLVRGNQRYTDNIRQSAREEVLASHTWTHRAQKVLADCQSI